MTTLTAANPMATGGLLPGPPIRFGPAPTATAGLTGADFLRILRQRLVLIIILWLVGLALTAGFTAFMIIYFPEYQAYALVRVKSTDPINVLNPLEQRGQQEKEVQLLVQNQAVLMESPEVLRSVLDDPAIKETEWYRWARLREETKGEDLIELLDKVVSASPVRDTNYVRVTGSLWVASEVPTVVNTIVSRYLKKVEDMQRGGLIKTRDQLDDEVLRAEKQFEGKRTELEVLRSTTDVLGLQGGPSEHLLTLEALVTELEVDLIGRKTQYESLANTTPDQLPITAELQAILSNDPAILQMERVVQDYQLSLSQVEAKFGKNHPLVKSTQVSMESALQAVGEERSVKLLRYQKEQIEQARRNYIEAQQQLMELKDRRAAARAEQKDRDKNYATYLRLLEEQDVFRTQYEALLEQRNLMTITSRSQNIAQIDIASSATPPKQRSSPRWSIWMPAGGMLGLLVAVGVAFLLELADKSVRTPRDVPRIPVLGTIPNIDDDEVEIERAETASIDAPHSVTAEAFRSLRANLFFCAPAEQQGVVLVTSSSGGNGKTTVACNLAISVALSGRRVLLIDANFRRASLAKFFPNARAEGLSNILIGQSKLADLVTSTNVPGLDLLTAGPIPPNPAELLGSSYLRDLIVDARSIYDQVIVDGPPVLLVSDVIVLAGAVDGILMVCQYRATSRGALQRTQGQLDAISARVFGAVLNKVETRAGGYFRKVYREFYEYQEPEERLPGEQPKKLDAQTESDRQSSSSAEAASGAPPATKPAEPDAAVKAPEKVGQPVASVEALVGNLGPSPLDEVIDLGLDFKIDDNFDLGEDFGQAKKPAADSGKSKGT